jgi:predicted PurR-regulated permease PerM
MRKALGLNPIVTILAILIGARLAGILGALIAVPVATAFSVFIKDYLDSKTEESRGSSVKPPVDNYKNYASSSNSS